MKLENNYQKLGDLLIGPPNFEFKKNLLELDFWSDEERTFIGDLSDDDIASEHYSTFGMTVFPFGHYFISPGRNFGGDFDNIVIDLYQSYGFDHEKRSEGAAATHLGTQLMFLSFLIEKEKMHDARNFLGNDILNWIHSLSITLNETTGHIFPKLINHIEKDLLNLWEGLNGNDHLEEIQFSLVPFDYKADLLEDEKTSLKDIGETLMTPGLCGVFISKPTLTNFASQLEIPTGFGTRVMMMENIFKESVNYEKIDNLISMFNVYLGHWEKSYEDYPIAPVSKVWIERINQAKNILGELKNSLLK